MNMNLRDALAAIEREGGSWEPKRRTGEIVARHPLIERHVVVNGRRKDCPRRLIGLLNAIRRARERAV